MKQKKSKQTSRILVLEPDEQLASAICDALKQAAPDAMVEVTRSLEEAQQLVLGVKPELFVLDVDATQDLGQDFLYDLRTSHPNARAIVLTGVHLPEQREHVSGLGAIHFLEKPLTEWDFIDLVERLLRPAAAMAEKFEGTLSDLQFTDIIQLKCMSGATSVVEFTGPNGEKARVFFEKGQVRHATAPGRQGLAAFNEIVRWKGGKISEVTGAGPSPRTIEMDWQHLLMEAVQSADERAAAGGDRAKSAAKKLLAVDDSMMLLSFVKEVLIDAGYAVATASSGEEAVREAQAGLPDLILLDFILPDMKGDEVCRRLLQNPETAAIPVVYMSGYGAELQASGQNSNVIGFLNKPFTSDLLTRTVETHMPGKQDDPQPSQPEHQPSELFSEETRPVEAEIPFEEQPVYREVSEVDLEVPQTPETPQPAEAPWWTPAPSPLPAQEAAAPAAFEPAAEQQPVPDESLTSGVFFCGDTRFFSLNRALQIIANQKLTGTLSLFWEKSPVELLFQDGQIQFATSRDPELYCPEAPVTLSNVDPERIAAARAQQQETGCPLFITLMHENLILHEPASQLVQHHGQKLFAHLWSAPCIRFSFQQGAGALPDFASALPGEPDVDQWTLATLRLVQFPQLGNRAYYEPASIPAYTREGFERIQSLRLTVAEAQFASQFNGARSVQQIAKNLRLDLKFASVTLLRFLALEIIECWPPASGAGQEKKGIFQRLGQAVGLGE
ncbi:MAG TPA: response regulator [Chthoniobacterales bacterium]|jgi:DNA-binding response OmpR family regulator|nr:response regulator [Chthoniobacterales bacterium]